jgi:hypothetical protein
MGRELFEFDNFIVSFILDYLAPCSSNDKSIESDYEISILVRSISCRDSNNTYNANT